LATACQAPPEIESLSPTDYRKVEVVVYEALKKLAKRGVVQQTGQGAKLARFRL
jgi:hypothetical protein